MSRTTLPKTMRAWQYTTTSGGIEHTMRLNPSAPTPQRKPNQHIVKISIASLNPVDYKPAEIPYLGCLIVPNPATPACEFSGHIVEPADGSDLQPGEAVFGGVGKSPFAGGGLAEYAVVENDAILPVPKGISMTHAASVPVAGLTGYQTIQPYVKPGSRLFINGGSGGTGTLGIQIAKALGCHVTVTCSSANTDLCKSLGADEVIDYRQHNVLTALKSADQPFAHVVDNVGADTALFYNADQYTLPGAKYIWVAGTPSWRFLRDSFLMRYLPPVLGGGKRAFVSMFTAANLEQLAQIGRWMEVGTVKAVIDEVFDFGDAREAYRKSKTGRARGKVVVRVAGEGAE